MKKDALYYTWRPLMDHLAGSSRVLILASIIGLCAITTVWAQNSGDSAKDTPKAIPQWMQNFRLEMEGPRGPSEIDSGSAYFNNGSASVIVFKDSNRQNNFFNMAAAKHHVENQIQNCTLLMDVPVGTAGGNHSYGGICSVSENDKTSNSMVCADVMVGRFKAQKVEDQSPTTEQLAKFVIANCYGG